MWKETDPTSITEVLPFTRETCGACATQREKDEGIEDAYPGVGFLKVDIQTDLETAEEYGVRKTPTTIVYANKERTDTVGCPSVDAFATPGRRLSSQGYSRQYDEFIGIVGRDELEAAIGSADQRSTGTRVRQSLQRKRMGGNRQ